MGKNNFLPKCLFLLKNDFETMLFLFFFYTKRVGWVGFEKFGKFHTFLFLFLKASIMEEFKKIDLTVAVLINMVAIITYNLNRWGEADWLMLLVYKAGVARYNDS